jgi:hypothetical protein
MADAPVRKSMATTAPAPQASTMAVLAPAIGWLIPGAGHMIQKRWIRGLLLMVSVVAMFVLGLLMQGRIYKPNGNILDILRFIGDMCAGGMYIVCRALDLGNVVVAHATADYRTNFIVVSGLLNFISVADAYHIAIGKKQ